MNLFANGCSFTWGGGLFPNLLDENNQLLDYYNQSPLNVSRLQTVWPWHLGQQLNTAQVVNLSLGCASNERILRTTLEFFSQPEIIKEKWIAVIQWTVPHRFEYWDDENLCWVLGSPTWMSLAGPQIVNNYDDRSIVGRTIYTHYNDKTYTQKFWTQLASCHAFLKNSGITHWFTRLQRIQTEWLSIDQIRYLNDNIPWIDSDPRHDFGRMFSENHRLPLGHPDATAHLQIATYINEKIINDIAH